MQRWLRVGLRRSQFIRSHSSCCGGHGHIGSAPELTVTNTADVNRCKRLILIGGAVNAGYCILKIGFGQAGGSVALTADGLHALVDCMSDACAYAALAISRWRFSRCKFPYGVGRLETIAAGFVGCLLLAGAFGLVVNGTKAIYNALIGAKQHPATCTSTCGDHNHQHDNHGHSHGLADMLSHGHSHDFKLLEKDEGGTPRIVWFMVAIAASSVIVKEILYRIMIKTGSEVGSAVVVAAANHHRADAMSACLGLVGVVGTTCGAPLLDAVMGLGVAALVGRVSVRMLSKAALEFFDYQDGDLDKIRRATRSSISDDCPDLVLRKCAAVNVFATRHGSHFVLHGTLLVPADLPSAVVGRLTRHIKAAVGEQFPSVILDTFFKVQCIGEPLASSQSETVHDETWTLMDVIRIIAEFHNVPLAAVTALETEGDQLSGKVRIRESAKHLSEDCRYDVAACARVFGYTLVLE